MAVIDDGITADALLRSEGWALLTRLLESYEKVADRELKMNLSSDYHVLFRKQMAAQCITQIKDALLIDLQRLTQQAREELNIERGRPDANSE